MVSSFIVLVKFKMNSSRMKWDYKLLLQLILALQFAYQVSGHPTGADPSVCESMIPTHGTSPQSSPNPYKIILSKKDLSSNEKVNITLTSKSGRNEFKGFLIRVRKPNGGEDEAFGEFSETKPGLTKTLDCFGKPKSAMTHTSNLPKKSISVFWTPPHHGEGGDFEVLFSVVKDGYTFWTHEAHEELLHVEGNIDQQAGHEGSELTHEWREIYEGCSKTKGCFGIPDNCIESFDPKSSKPKTCEIMVTWKKEGGSYNHYELAGRTGDKAGKGYLALGLSHDYSMGNDSVVGCTFSGPEDHPRINRYYNKGRSNQQYSVLNEGILPLDSIIVDGNMFCKFRQYPHEIKDAGFFDVDNHKFYYLLSRGVHVSDDGLGKHKTNADRASSPEAVHITKTTTMSKRRAESSKSKSLSTSLSSRFTSAIQLSLLFYALLLM